MFSCGAEWDKNYETALGSATKTLFFDTGFVLTEQVLRKPGGCSTAALLTTLSQPTYYPARRDGRRRLSQSDLVHVLV